MGNPYYKDPRLYSKRKRIEKLHPHLLYLEPFYVDLSFYFALGIRGTRQVYMLDLLLRCIRGQISHICRCKVHKGMVWYRLSSDLYAIYDNVYEYMRDVATICEQRGLVYVYKERHIWYIHPTPLLMHYISRRNAINAMHLHALSHDKNIRSAKRVRHYNKDVVDMILAM